MSDLAFVRVRIGITTLNDEDGWRIVVQQGNDRAKVTKGTWANREDALDMARAVARAYEAQLDEAKIPWSKG